MQGKIKWFSEEKGYGYIVGEDDKEYYFSVREVQGADLPGNGDIISFESVQGKRGPRATSVVIIKKNQSKARTSSRGSDERVTCLHCGKKIVPRIISYQGSIQKSVCPFCGGVYKDFSNKGCLSALGYIGGIIIFVFVVVIFVIISIWISI